MLDQDLLLFYLFVKQHIVIELLLKHSYINFKINNAVSLTLETNVL